MTLESKGIKISIGFGTYTVSDTSPSGGAVLSADVVAGLAAAGNAGNKIKPEA